MRTTEGPLKTWGDEIEAWAAWMRAGGRSPGTTCLRAHYVTRLGRALSTAGLGPWDAGGDDLAGWLSSQEWKPETRRSAVVSIRGFYTWGARTGRIASSPAAELDGVHVPAGMPRPAPEDALTAALAAADERTRLMLELAARAGLRRAEIAAVRGIDVEHDGVGASLRVRGKGGVERTIPISDQLATAITSRAERETGNRFGWVFPRRSDPTQHLTPGHVGRLMTTALPHPWTPHSLRHRFASRAYAADRDIRAVQELLGHASVTTTQRYTAVPQDAKRRAVAAAL